MSKKKLSVIVSCYNEEEAIPYFYDEIVKISKKMDYLDFEYIFVDDGSKDDTLNVIKQYAKKDKRVRYVSFSRNFGKEAAMFAGLETSKGDYVTVMDADLQDPPVLLETMYNLISKDGYDCVGTRRVTRKGEPPIRSFFARIFYKIINKISKTEMVDGARDYRLMTRPVVDAIISMKEYNRYSKGIFSFVGFKTKWLEYENIERVAGETKWSFWKLFKYAIEGIVGFSTSPLVASLLFGTIIAFISLILLICFLLKLIFVGFVYEYIWIILTVLLTNGIMLISVGILGLYLSKTYLEVKNRPIYIVKETEDSSND